MRYVTASFWNKGSCCYSPYWTRAKLNVLSSIRSLTSNIPLTIATWWQRTRINVEPWLLLLPFSLRILKNGCLCCAVYCCPRSSVYFTCSVKANQFICLWNLPQLPNHSLFYLRCVICPPTKLLQLQLQLQPLKLQLSGDHRILLLSHSKSMVIEQTIRKCGS